MSVAKIDELVIELQCVKQELRMTKAELAVAQSPVPRMIDRWFSRSLASKRGHETKRSLRQAKVTRKSDELRAERRGEASA